MIARNGFMPVAGPALRASIPFAGGILLASWFQPPPSWLAACAVFFVILTIAARNMRIAGDLAAVTSLFLTGAFSCAASEVFSRPLMLPRTMLSGEIRIEGRVCREPVNRPGYSSFLVSCESIKKNGTSYRADGLVMCVLPQKGLTLAEGTRVTALGTLRSGGSLPVKGSAFSRGIGSPGMFRLLVTNDSSGFAVTGESGSIFNGLRHHTANLARAYNYHGHRDLLLAMTIGYTAGLKPETRDTFTRSGIAHLLAVSGMNVGVVAASVLFLLGLMPLGGKTRYVMCGSFLLVYAGICGFQPPVSRALIMMLILSGSFLLERRGSSENALFAALIAILAFDPAALSGASLQLSFAAAWSLAVFYQPLMTFTGAYRIRIRFLRSVAGLAAATAIASTVTAPVAAAHFGIMPATSLPINLFAVPLASLITISGMLSLALTAAGTLLQPAAETVAYGTGLLLTVIEHIADLGASLPFATIETGRIPMFFGASFAVWCYILSRSSGRPAFRKALVYLPLIVSAICIWEPVAHSAPGDEGSVTWFDVGQGDAALVYWHGKSFLVDAGPVSASGRSAAETVILPSLGMLGVKRLDAVIVSHMDADHAGGLDFLARNVPARKIFCRGAVRDSLAVIYGPRVTAIGAGDSLTFEGGGLLVLSPCGDNTTRTGENSMSLVVRFSCGGRTILFPGDIGPDVQRSLVKWKDRLRTDILVIPHHGARGLDTKFLAASGPQLAVISCGLNNRFGHPASETVGMIARSGARIIRTDLDGGIIVRLPDMTAATSR